MLEDVKTVRAHVRNGSIVLDEQVELPEGAAVRVIVPENDEIDVAVLDAEIDASILEFERGEFEDARAFAAKLSAKA